VVALDGDGLPAAIDRLRIEDGIHRMSSIGGRFTASRLVDAGLAQDLYLTTTSREGGEPGTPWYSGASPPRLDVLTAKRWEDRGAPIRFEQLAITDGRSSASASRSTAG
jgi:hypothetical protein